jgi:hypothetical protein
MDGRELILSQLRAFFQRDPSRSLLARFNWDDDAFLRNCLLRQERGDEAAWCDLVELLDSNRSLAWEFRCYLESEGYLCRDYSDDLAEQLRIGLLQSHGTPLSDEDSARFIRALEAALEPRPTPADTPPSSAKAGRTQIMYIEAKPGLTGPARIGRVRFSKSGKTLYYKGRRFQSLKGGYKRNYFDVETGEEYWISGCRKDGQDTLYPGVVQIDDDVREEYWMTIRQRPDMVHLSSYRSEGRYSKRRPC